MLLLSNIKHCKYVVSCCIFNFETPKLRRIYINIAYTRKFAIFITKFRELISHQRFGIRINLFSSPALSLLLELLVNNLVPLGMLIIIESVHADTKAYVIEACTSILLFAVSTIKGACN